MTVPLTLHLMKNVKLDDVTDACCKITLRPSSTVSTHFFIGNFHLSSEPGVAIEILENEPKKLLNSCLVLLLIFTRFS